MDRIIRDARFAFRSLLKSPLLTGAAVLSLGLGIGANASIFSAVDVFLIRPLDFEEADNLVTVWTTDTERGWTDANSSVPDYIDWREQSRTLDLAVWQNTGVNMSGTDRPERLEARTVTANFFDVLRKRPVLGRGFSPEEEQAGGPGVAILGDAVWQRSFGADPGVIGRVISLDGLPYEIIGVMPPRVRFGNEPDVWLPARFTGEESRSSRGLAILGRIRDGSDLDAARTDMNAIQSRLAAEFPASNANTGVNIVRLQDDWFDEGFRQGSLISSTAVLLVLLIACANVANLLLARAAGRDREIALRGALGARRGMIVRQLLTESMILALAGGALGIMFAVVGVRALRGLFPPFLAGVEGVQLNGRVLAFTAIITIASGFVFGLVPALRTARLNLRGLLTDGGRGNTSTGGARLRTGLVVSEISLALVLLVSSALLIQAFVKIRTAETGFRIDDVVTLALSLPASKYDGAESVTAFTNEVVDRVAALPGVQAAGVADRLPMLGGSSRYYTVPTEQPPEPGREPVVSIRTISPGYMDAMGMTLLRGRNFNRSDTDASPRVVLINELMAAQHWPGRDPIGQRIRFSDEDHEIVGLVANTRDYGPDDEAGRMVYFPMAQRPARTMSLVVYTTLPTDQVAESVRSVVRAVDPEQPVYGLTTMATITEEEISGNMAMVKVLGSLALIAFLLSGVGVYGVMAYSVTQRSMEMGIRMALGAQRAMVLRLVIRRGALITGLGIGIGLLAALGVTRLLSFFLYGVSPFSPVAFGSVTIMLAITGMVASWLPAMRATRVDPIVALRAD